MKKHIRQILKYTGFLLISILISGIFCPSQSVAQMKPPLAQKSDVWELHYFVKVKGDFKVEPELGADGPTISYHIERNYEGASKLVFSPRPDDPKAAFLHPTFKDPDSKIHITINDSRTAVFPPLCGESSRVEDTWTAEVMSWMGNNRFPALLLINNEKLSYKTSFPILYFPKTNSDDIAHNRKTTEHLNSGEDKVTVSPVVYQSFSTHGYPNVKGFIENASIIRAPDWSELEKDESLEMYSWHSDVLHPDEPLIRNVPESKDNVEIVISYNFSRVKG